MRDLFLQCTCVWTYVCVCRAQDCQFALTCTQRTSYVTCTDTGESRMPSLAMEDREEQRFLPMEDGYDNAVGPPQCMCFAESNTERSRRLAALRKRKQRSQGTVEAKRARREWEKVQKKKACCGESSQARYKLCSLFMFDSTVVVLELHGACANYAHIRTCTHWRGTARCKASCTCVVLE